MKQLILMEYPFIYQEKDGDEDAFLHNVQDESVVKGCKLFLDKKMEVKQEEYRKADAIKQKLAKESKGEDDIDADNIKQIVATSEMGGKSMEIIQLEFEHMPELDNIKGRGWRHKRTGRTFLQYKSSKNNSWDTRVCNKQLKIVKWRTRNNGRPCID